MGAETFVHEFKSPINCYRAVAVRHGRNVYQVSVYEGRQCYVTDSQRIRNPRGGYFNSLSVHFLDDGSHRCIPAGRFNKAAKSAPLPAGA